MCNLSEAIEERGIKKGIEIGIEKGIRIFIQDNLNEGKSKEIIIKKLTTLCELSPEEAETYYNQYKVPQNV